MKELNWVRADKAGVARWALRTDTIGNPECPHFRRWVVATPLFGVRLHHFVGPDTGRAPHDHPFGFVTVVLAGSYRDVSDSGRVDELRRGSVRYRPAEHRHRVESDGAWTLVFTGRVRRTWGFWDDGRFIDYKTYGRLHGHAPCDDTATR